jgi:acetyl-CoA carboxylase / biotin carboxylase 1
MVAWLVTMKSLEYPLGREFVLIANDITHQAGSFGTKEDYYFYKASEYARLKKIPRIYIASNSGARIGMAESLKKIFRVCWSEENDPSKGFQYIYLTQGQLAALYSFWRCI